MTASSATAIPIANRAGSISEPKMGEAGPTSLAIIKRFKEMYEKPKETLAAWLGISESTAKRTLAGRRELMMEEFAALLHSERGFDFLCVVMAEKRPQWWCICAPLMDLADIRMMELAAKRRMQKAVQGAIDAHRDLSATIARSEALAIQDEEHMRPHLDALRSMDRAPDSAMAAPSKKQR